MNGKDPPGKPGASNKNETETAKEKRTYENMVYTYRDMAPYRVYVELRNRENDQKINKYMLGSAMLALNMKTYVIDMKYVGKYKIIVFLNNFNKANELVHIINTKNVIYRAYVPKHLVSISGVVSGVEVDLEEEFIRQNMECEVPIMGVRRMTRYVPGEGKIPISRICVTFRSNELPKSVKLLCCVGSVQPFTPKVVVCDKCLRFGHRTENCRGAIRCSKCSERHENAAQYSNCHNDAKCAHCKSPEHSSTNEMCPERKRQQEIRTLMARKNVTFIEAREQVRVFSHNIYEPLQNADEFPPLEESYASITGGQYKWTNPLREEWINTNQERKQIKAAIKTYPNKPRNNQTSNKRYRSDHTETNNTTDQKNIIVNKNSHGNKNGVALNNPHKVDKQELHNAYKEGQLSSMREFQESMVAFYSEFIGNINCIDPEIRENTTKLFKSCTKKHFNLANIVIQPSSDGSMEVQLPEESDENC